MAQAVLESIRSSGYAVSELKALLSNGVIESILWPGFQEAFVNNPHTHTSEKRCVCVVALSLLLGHALEDKSIDGWGMLGLAAEQQHAVQCLLAAVSSYLIGFCTNPETSELSKFPDSEISWLLRLISLTFESLELEGVRKFVFRITGLPSWWHLGQSVRANLFLQYPTLKPHWDKTEAVIQQLELQENLPLGTDEKKLSAYVLQISKHFLVTILRRLLQMNTDETAMVENIWFIERALDLFIAAWSHLPIRRIVKPLCSAHQLLGQLSMGLIPKRCAYFFSRMEELDALFEDEVLRELGQIALSPDASVIVRLGRLQRHMQLIASEGEESKFLQHSLHSLRSKQVLKDALEELSVPTLEGVLSALAITTKENLELLVCDRDSPSWKNLIVSLAVYNLARPTSWPDRVRNTVLFPNEKTLWGDTAPISSFSVEQPLPLPRMGIQFLHLNDLFLRNFDLFRLEAFYQIRQDVERAVCAMRPSISPTAGVTEFKGESKMARRVISFSTVSFVAPAAGESVPQKVRAELLIDLTGCNPNIKNEWDSLRANDLLFLLTIAPPSPGTELPYKPHEVAAVEDFPSTFSILVARTCQITDVLDEEGQSLISLAKLQVESKSYGAQRTIRVTLDPQQYQQDLQAIGRGELFDQVYSSFNLVIRRKPEANNLKGVLGCLRNLMLKQPRKLVPDHIADLVLGFGGRQIAHPFNKIPDEHSINFGHTFNDADHLKASFPFAKEISFSQEALEQGPPYVLKFKLADEQSVGFADNPLWNYCPRVENIMVHSSPPSQSKANPKVRYTPAQVLAIRSGLSGSGITIILGPPGTGKTDTAIQLVSLILENNPNERVLTVARSNQSLNDFFSKIAGVGISEKYLLRLGMGEKDLQVAQDEMTLADTDRERFSKWGRVNHLLRIRDERLADLSRLTKAMNIETPVDMDCEVASQIQKWQLPSRMTLAQNSLNMAKKLMSEKPNLSAWDAVIKTLEACKVQATWWRFMTSLECLSLWIEAPAKLKEAIRLHPGVLTATASSPTVKHEEDSKSEGPEDDEEPTSIGEDATAMEENATAMEENATAMDMSSATGRSPMELLYESKLRRGCDLETRLTTKGFFYGGISISLHEIFYPFFGCSSIGADSFGSSENDEQAKMIAKNGYEEIQCIFKELRECRPFELLRSTADRAEHLASSFAKIVAMTSTHCALVREQLLATGFRYETLVIEEAAQILDIETLIPMLLQKDPTRLKRVIFLGDHLQLAPIVQNPAISIQCNFQQSLFARLIRLGVPYVQLDAQGRCRSELASNFRWRYGQLGDLDFVKDMKLANPGLAFTHQFVDCPDGEETSIVPHAYQNANEADYVVALFMYMRLIGIPGSQITVLTLYNGQKQLVKEKMKTLCGWNQLIGFPHKITTVDRFQGQQNQYIIASLVRTRRMGYVADPRRLTVLLSRAQRGLYVVGNFKLVSACFAVAPFFKEMFNHPLKLGILPAEKSDSSFSRESTQHLMNIVAELVHAMSA